MSCEDVKLIKDNIHNLRLVRVVDGDEVRTELSKLDNLTWIADCNHSWKIFIPHKVYRYLPELDITKEFIERLEIKKVSEDFMQVSKILKSASDYRLEKHLNRRSCKFYTIGDCEYRFIINESEVHIGAAIFNVASLEKLCISALAVQLERRIDREKSNTTKKRLLEIANKQ